MFLIRLYDHNDDAHLTENNFKKILNVERFAFVKSTLDLMNKQEQTGIGLPKDCWHNDAVYRQGGNPVKRNYKGH